MSPSLYAILAGGVLGAAVNVLTARLTLPEERGGPAYYAGLCFLAAALCLIYIAIRLELARSRAIDLDHFQELVKSQRWLFWAAAASFGLVVVGLLIISTI